MRRIRDSMPFILQPATWPVWLGEEEGDARALLLLAAEDVLRSWAVSRNVNSPRHNRPDLLDPVKLPDQLRNEAEAEPDSA